MIFDIVLLLLLVGGFSYLRYWTGKQLIILDKNNDNALEQSYYSRKLIARLLEDWEPEVELQVGDRVRWEFYIYTVVAICSDGIHLDGIDGVFDRAELTFVKGK